MNGVREAVEEKEGLASFPSPSFSPFLSDGTGRGYTEVDIDLPHNFLVSGLGHSRNSDPNPNPHIISKPILERWTSDLERLSKFLKVLGSEDSTSVLQYSSLSSDGRVLLRGLR